MSDAGRARLSPNATAAVVLGVLAVGLLLWQQPWSGDPEGPAAVPVPEDAPALIAEQVRALSAARTRADFVAAAGDGAAARELAEQAWQARAELGVTEVDLRYVGGGDVADRADGSTVARVRVSWTVGPDSVVAGTSVRDVTVDLRLDPRPDGTLALREVRAPGATVPLWLAGEVDVRTTGDVRVVAVDGGVPDVDVARLAARGRESVVAVDPRVEGPVTVVSPRTGALAARLIGRAEEEVADIAAVTTTVDGSTDTARVIVVNPDVFATMDERATQVVMSHEATHLLTDTIGSDVETWVAEGYADWVALRDDDAPLTLSAGQVLRQVRAEGPPDALPDATDFATADHGLGAVYESAWMVFRMLDERVDDAEIVAFYDDVLAGTPVEQALGSAFGLDVAELTRRWRAYLTKSASTVS